MNILPAKIPSLVWCDHVINEFFLMSTPQAISDCIIIAWGVDIRQNFIYHMITPHKKWNSCRQYRMNSQQYCSLGIIHDGSAGNCLKWTEVGDEA